MPNCSYSDLDFSKLSTEKKMILVDIDGTVADGSHRLRFISETPKNWDAFFSAVSEDKPLKQMIRLVKSLFKAGELEVVFVTGRPEKTRADTLRWLNVVFQPIEIESWRLFMRKDGDHSPDFILKRLILGAMRKAQLQPRIAIEDRKRVVDMYRASNIICLQCADGDF